MVWFLLNLENVRMQRMTDSQMPHIRQPPNQADSTMSPAIADTVGQRYIRHVQEQATLWHFQRMTVWTYWSSTVFQIVLKGYHHGLGAKSSKWIQRLWGVQFKKNAYPIAPEVCWHPWFSSVAYACTIWQNLALFLWVNGEFPGILITIDFDLNTLKLVWGSVA